MTEQERSHLDYVRRVLEGALLYIDVNSVPASARVRNNIQNAVHSISDQLRPGFDSKMQAALEADGETLRQLTGADHGPHFLK